MLSFKEYLDKDFNDWILEEGLSLNLNPILLKVFGKTAAWVSGGITITKIIDLIHQSIENSKDRDKLIILTKYKSAAKKKCSFLYQSKAKNDSSEYIDQIKSLKSVISNIEKDIESIKKKINEK